MSNTLIDRHSLICFLNALAVLWHSEAGGLSFAMCSQYSHCFVRRVCSQHLFARLGIRSLFALTWSLLIYFFCCSNVIPHFWLSTVFLNQSFSRLRLAGGSKCFGSFGIQLLTIPFIRFRFADQFTVRNQIIRLLVLFPVCLYYSPKTDSFWPLPLLMNPLLSCVQTALSNLTGFRQLTQFLRQNHLPLSALLDKA